MSEKHSIHSDMTQNLIYPDQNVRVAFLEDDAIFAAELQKELESLNYKVEHFENAKSCIEKLISNDYDLCIFDQNLPDMSGVEVMCYLQNLERMPPVIFLTGYDSESDVTTVLNSGADDYIVKPPSINLLNARIKAILRRLRVMRPQIGKEFLGHLVIDYLNKTIFRDGKPVALTGTELTIAFFLFMHRGRVVKREQLNDLLKIPNLAIDTRRLDVHISHLRSKLGLTVMNGWKLSSIYKCGYRLEYIFG